MAKRQKTKQNKKTPKNRNTIRSSNPTAGYVSEENENTSSKRYSIHSSIFIFLFRATPAVDEVPRLRVKSELQLPAYTTATAMPDPSHICDLRHSSRQRRILNPLSEARDLPTSSWILVRFLTCWATAGTPQQHCLQKPRYASNWSVHQQMTR